MFAAEPAFWFGGGGSGRSSRRLGGGNRAARSASARVQEPAWDWAAAHWEQLQQRGGSLVPIGALEYPPLLREISAPLALLHVLGDLRLASATLAIVGSRSPTSYGLKVARQLARALAALGFGVVSGMARGIDTAAHQGAGDAPSPCWAVAPMWSIPAKMRHCTRGFEGRGQCFRSFPWAVAPKRVGFPVATA